ncbi:MAG: methyltransferase [Solobacterium sp.]|nr:methyltransferase [Solobacterium sp.]
MGQTHYFTDNSTLPSNRKDHEFTFSGHRYIFRTDDGVFSKSEVDYGSRALLKALEKEDLQGAVLDMGCGYGVIGIVLKTLFPDCAVTCADVNPRAAELAVINSSINSADIRVLISDRFEQISDHFDAVVTNPPIRAGKKTVYAIFEEAYDHLNDGGLFFAVIRKQQGAESAAAKLTEIFGSCQTVLKDKGYRVLKCRRIKRVSDGI